MFQFLRRSHRLIGVCAALFLMVIAVTGFLLALKREIAWMRPTEKDGPKSESMAEVVDLHTVMAAVYALQLPEIQEIGHVDRIDYRPKDNVFKVVSKTGWKEVQVNGKTGQVLNVADRNDSFIETIHDMSFWHDNARTYIAPVVATALFALSCTGVYMYVNPILRRRKYLRDKAKAGTQS